MSKDRSSEQSAKIEFQATVARVQTLVDGGLRVTLDLPEGAIPQAAMLMECKRQAIPMVFSARAEAT